MNTSYPAQSDIPSFDDLAADPEIAALLDFEPVPRQIEKANGWGPAMQRMFIGWLAHYGSPGNAAGELGKARSGIDKVYKTPGADSFRAAWDGAVALAQRRLAERLASARSGAGAMRAPTINTRRKLPSAEGEGWGEGAPGEVKNEYGEWEDEGLIADRVDAAKERMRQRMLAARRLFLQEIGACPGKRAAFEILTQLPVDWDRAARLEPQEDEPWASPNVRRPEMLLAAESGWLGEMPPGPDKMAELRRAIDEHRVSQGLEPVEWESESTERSDAGAARSVGLDGTSHPSAPPE